MEFSKVWAKHSFYYIQYISVYIQPRYFYLIFRSVNGKNMNRVILHSVRPSFWKKRDFSHAPRCGSTESGCEISVPWWLILADRGKMTSVWSRDRDTGDTSERFSLFQQSTETSTCRAWTWMQTPDVDPMLAQNWATVYDAGPVLSYHWVKVSRFLGFDEWSRVIIVASDHSSKHDTSTQRWTNVGPPSTTSVQHWTNNGYDVFFFWAFKQKQHVDLHPVLTYDNKVTK